jgi:DNA-binding XRE family transcriptional regulator
MRKRAYDYAYPKVYLEMVRTGNTLETLAQIIGMSKYTLLIKLNGKSEWTINEIDKLCIYFGKDYYELFK